MTRIVDNLVLWFSQSSFCSWGRCGSEYCLCECMFAMGKVLSKIKYRIVMFFVCINRFPNSVCGPPCFLIVSTLTSCSGMFFYDLLKPSSHVFPFFDRFKKYIRFWLFVMVTENGNTVTVRSKFSGTLGFPNHRPVCYEHVLSPEEGCLVLALLTRLRYNSDCG